MGINLFPGFLIFWMRHFCFRGSLDLIKTALGANRFGTEVGVEGPDFLGDDEVLVVNNLLDLLASFLSLLGVAVAGVDCA